VFFAWLLLYLAQSLLVANRRVDLHRKLGLTSIVLLAVMIPLGFATTSAMVRRGFDLSGDQHIDPHQTETDGATSSVFNLFALLAFSLLAAAAICYRHRPGVHKRLMVFAPVPLMTASIAHLLGHIPSSWFPVGGDIAFAILYIPFLLAPIAFDYFTEKRIRLLTTALALGLFAYQLLLAFAIAPSPAWHRLAEKVLH